MLTFYILHISIMYMRKCCTYRNTMREKMKTKEAHVKEALLKAVYFYLENADED